MENSISGEKLLKKKGIKFILSSKDIRVLSKIRHCELFSMKNYEKLHNLSSKVKN